MNRKPKAIALMSGGLDSLLAARLVKEQGIDVLGVVFIMPFASRDVEAFETRVKASAAEGGIGDIRAVDISDVFLDMLSAPSHGYGSHINPCIDCKILMLREAAKIMAEEKADFVITGEVLGERPMSQRRAALDIIKKDSGLEGRLLRPLSARLMEETIPEKEGLIDRERLLDIRGRSRAPQFRLAEEYGITRFSAPAGGCLLTDPIFARKLKDLMENGSAGIYDIMLLKYGRHFRLDNRTKAVVGRDEEENIALEGLLREGDALLRLRDEAGPDVLLRGDLTLGNTKTAASLCVSHSRSRAAGKAEVTVIKRGEDESVVEAPSLDRGEIDGIRV